MPLWTPRLVLCPRASMMLGVPVLISSMKWMILNGFTNFGFKNKHLINRRSCNLTCQSCYGAEWGRQSQNTVEHWKQSIWNVNQGRQVSRQRQTKRHSYLLTRIWNLHFGTSVLWKLWKRQLPALGRSFDSEFSVNCQLHGDRGKLLNNQSAWGFCVMKIWLLANNLLWGINMIPASTFKLTILTVRHTRWKSTLVFWGRVYSFFNCKVQSYHELPTFGIRL